MNQATQTPELRALSEACRRLDGAGLEYMLTGSLALSYYATPRMTRDIDLVIAVDASAAGRLVSALGDDFHADEVALEQALREERPWNVVFMPELVKIDLIPRKSSAHRRLEFERRTRVDFAGVPIWIVSVEDLIIAKLEWARDSGSQRQMEDVRTLLQATHDASYLAQWVATLNLAAVLAKARS